MDREDQRRRVAGGAPIQLGEQIPEDLRRFLSRALAPERHQRFRATSELALELGSLMVRRLEKDPRSTLAAWLAKHPLAPKRLGDLPALITLSDATPRIPTVKVKEDASDEDPTLLAGELEAWRKKK